MSAPPTLTCVPPHSDQSALALRIHIKTESPWKPWRVTVFPLLLPKATKRVCSTYATIATHWTQTPHCCLIWHVPPLSEVSVQGQHLCGHARGRSCGKLWLASSFNCWSMYVQSKTGNCVRVVANRGRTRSNKEMISESSDLLCIVLLGLTFCQYWVELSYRPFSYRGSSG